MGAESCGFLELAMDLPILDFELDPICQEIQRSGEFTFGAIRAEDTYHLDEASAPLHRLVDS